LITAREFEERLATLCASASGAAFPRRQRDRHILFRCVIQCLEAGKPYSEQSLTTGLLLWSSDVGSGIDIDHATLRRYLVDEGYLLRSADGSAYRVNLPGNGQVEFERSIAAVDSSQVIQRARQVIADRKSERSSRINSPEAGPPSTSSERR